MQKKKQRTNNQDNGDGTFSTCVGGTYPFITCKIFLAQMDKNHTFVVLTV